MKKVLVSGCFDLIHAGHICFLENAATYGDLYVSIGSDSTIKKLKREPIYSEKERLYLVNSLKCVQKAFISRGSGVLDFIEELMELRPDILIVNSDGHSEEKEKLCAQYEIEYIVLDRTPAKLMPQRSTTEVLRKINMPYRIDIAGGWLDQPWVSCYNPGPVLTVSIEPNYEFPDRTGMATSTRKRAIRLWGNDIPFGDKEELAKILFCYDNFPGSEYVSGSQDSIGIVFPGISKLDYDGRFWPENIESINDMSTIFWLEENCKLIPMPSKPSDYSVLQGVNLKRSSIKDLAKESEMCWTAINELNVIKFGKHVSGSFDKQVGIFPKMMTPRIRDEIERYKSKSYGMKVTGSGGFMFIITPETIENEIRIKIRIDYERTRF